MAPINTHTLVRITQTNHRRRLGANIIFHQSTGVLGLLREGVTARVVGVVTRNLSDPTKEQMVVVLIILIIKKQHGVYYTN